MRTRYRYRGLGAEEEESRFSRLEIDEDEPPRRSPAPPPPREAPRSTRTRRQVYALDCRKTPTYEIPEEISQLSITDEEAAAFVARELLADRIQESFVALHLNSTNQVVGYEELAKGSVESVAVSPKDVFRSALCTPTTRSIILVHNHPSGDPTPSQADVELTQEIVKIGNSLGMPVLDHIVVSDRGYVPMRRIAPRLGIDFAAVLTALAVVLGGGFIATQIAKGKRTA